MTRVAAIQMVSTGDLEMNLQQAARQLFLAASAGARVAVLPENFALFSTRQMFALGQREACGDGRVRHFLAGQARQLGLWIVAGSVPLASRPDGSLLQDRVRSACLVLDDQGEIRARYDKIHLFDADVSDGQGRYRESETFEPGEDPVVVDTPAGRLGLAICYDLRFPELFRQLRMLGADWIALPAAFTWQTGQAHWEVLLRARAIENQFWICAAGQGGSHDPQRQTWGHSMIVDPWGKVVDCLAGGEGLVQSALDLQQSAELRARMPVHAHIRLR